MQILFAFNKNTCRNDENWKMIHLLIEVDDLFINGISNNICTGKHINYFSRTLKNFTKRSNFDLHRYRTMEDEVHILRGIWNKNAFVRDDIKYLDRSLTLINFNIYCRNIDNF